MGFIKNFDTLASNDNRRVVLELLEAAFASIVPQEVFKNDFSLQENILKIQNQTFDLSQFERIFLVGFGKGSSGICKILEEKLGNKLTEGYDIDVVDETFNKVHYTKGTHPLPSQANFDYTQMIIDKLTSLTEKDLVLITTCGGGSVLFEKPQTFSLDQMIAVNKALLHSGATISEMNIVRKHLSRVKGGGLAKILYPATIINLIFSDVPGNDLSVIASAPLVKDPTTVHDAVAVCEKYNLSQHVIPSVVEESHTHQDTLGQEIPPRATLGRDDKKTLLSPEDFVETPKEDNYFKKISNILFLSNHTALNAMEKKAKELGYQAFILTDALQGDARAMGQKLIDQTPAGHILLAGGETTIKITGKGRGGRNQALVAFALPFLKDQTVIASFDSDGWDFYEYAGAIADQDTLKKIEDQHLDVRAYLDDDNSYDLWQKIGDGVDTGKLESNVSDLFIVFKPAVNG